MAPEPLIFVHIPHTGGSSLLKLARQVYTDICHVPLVQHGALAELSTAERSAQFWFAHMPFGLHIQLDKPTRYVTILRDPLARAISTCRRDPKRTLVDVAHEMQSAVYRLAGRVVQVPPQLRARHMTRADLDTALQNLQYHFAYIGDTSRLDEMGEFLRDECGWDVELPMPHENVGNWFDAPTQEEVEAASMCKEMALDLELYSLVQELGPRPGSWLI